MKHDPLFHPPPPPVSTPLPIKIKYLIGILGISTIALLVATIVQSTRSDADYTDTAKAQAAGAALVRSTCLIKTFSLSFLIGTIVHTWFSFC
jgi:hypothetical protein